jgi:hypothetical protein
VFLKSKSVWVFSVSRETISLVMPIVYLVVDSSTSNLIVVNAIITSHSFSLDISLICACWGRFNRLVDYSFLRRDTPVSK